MTCRRQLVARVSPPTQTHMHLGAKRGVSAVARLSEGIGARPGLAVLEVERGAVD